MSANVFRYEGKRILVVGGATGMGAAAAKTAAELHNPRAERDQEQPDESNVDARDGER